MPNTTSAKKAFRQSERRRVQNTKRRRSYKSVITQIRKSIATGAAADVLEKIPTLYKTLDKAAKTHAIPWNRASRLKSRIIKTLKNHTSTAAK
jgi:ribosomal protein S20